MSSYHQEKHTQNKRGVMNTAELLVQCLENEGVEYIFGLPGEENSSAFTGIKAVINSIHLPPAMSQRSGPLWRNVYGRLTGKAGVLPIYPRARSRLI